MKVYIIALVIMAYTACCSADSFFTLTPGNTDRDAAHIGTSAALNTFIYALDRKALGMPPMQSFIFAAATTLTIGLTYKMLEPRAGWGEINHAMLWNNVGVGISGLTISIGSW